jgi:hypothetical protein
MHRQKYRRYLHSRRVATLSEILIWSQRTPGVRGCRETDEVCRSADARRQVAGHTGETTQPVNKDFGSQGLW